jgi:tRNA (adenine57-N1/adenine58-N1)-methyltransferase
MEPVAFEVLFREWVAEGRSVRPASQMVGHTGFITVARKVAPGGVSDGQAAPPAQPPTEEGPR